MPKEIRAVSYARVSSREQAEKELSIPAQLEAMRNYCKQKGWKLVHEYIDAGKSAKTDDRPEFQRMISMAKKHNRNFDNIVVHKFDRFSRNREDHVIYKSLLKKMGVFVYSVTEQTDPDTPHGFLIEGIMEVISEFYNLNLRNEVFKGMTENAKRGFHNGGTAPYGYRLNKVSESSGTTKSILVPGPDDEVATVKRIFHNYVYDNYGYKKIASDLNIEVIPSSTGNQWSFSSIHSILHNEAYVGNTVWNMHDYSKGKKKKPEEEWIRKENTHVALVSKEIFDLIKLKSKSRIKNSNLFEASFTPFILRGLFKCPYCGANMVSGQSGNQKGTRTVRRYYLCGTYQRKGKSACKFKSFNKEKIEANVINSLIKELTFLTMDKVLNEELAKYNAESNKSNTFNLSNIERELELTKMRIELLEKDSSITNNKSQYKAYLEELNDKITNLNISYNSIKNELSHSSTTSESIDIVKNKMNYFKNNINAETPDKQNMLLKEYISSINYNLVNDVLSINLIIKSPENSTETLFEKILYTSL